jgi:hypothetical protein
VLDHADRLDANGLAAAVRETWVSLCKNLAGATQLTSLQLLKLNLRCKSTERAECVRQLASALRCLISLRRLEVTEACRNPWAQQVQDLTPAFLDASAAMASSVGALSQLTQLALSTHGNTVRTHDWCQHLRSLTGLLSLSLGMPWFSYRQAYPDTELVTEASLANLLGVLTQLTALSLPGSFARPTEVEAGVAAALPRLPHLCRLLLRFEAHGTAPAAAGQQPGLRMPGSLLASSADLLRALRIEIAPVRQQWDSHAEQQPALHVLTLNAMTGRAVFE